MHSMSIIHRDIKAENIVFRDSAAAAAAKGGPPVVKFIDLGMSTVYNKDHPEEGAMLFHPILPLLCCKSMLLSCDVGVRLQTDVVTILHQSWHVAHPWQRLA